jgi:hypothetical protein
MAAGQADSHRPSPSLIPIPTPIQNLIPTPILILTPIPIPPS